MVDVQTLSILFAGLSIAASLVYYANVLQNSNKARQAQLYIQIYDKFSSPDFMENYFIAMAREWKDYDDYTEKYASLRFTNPGEYGRQVSIGVYFEGIGVLLKHGFIDVQLVVDLIGTTVLVWWDKMQPYMEEYRIRLNNPRAYMYAEYLYDQVKRVVEKEHPALDTSTISLPPRPNP